MLCFGCISKNDKIEDLKIDDNESKIQPLEINENDELIQLQKLLDLGVVTLEEFDAKKILIEEKRIAEDVLKQKKLELELAKKNFKKKVEENKLALKSLKSFYSQGILTPEEYYSKVSKITESENIERKELNIEDNDFWNVFAIIVGCSIIALIALASSI